MTNSELLITRLKAAIANLLNTNINGESIANLLVKYDHQEVFKEAYNLIHDDVTKQYNSNCYL